MPLAFFVIGLALSEARANLDTGAPLGTIPVVGVRPEKARLVVALIPSRDPTGLSTLLLLAGAAKTPEEVNAAIRRLEEARANHGDKAKFHIALGVLYLRKQDATRAESAFVEAVAKEPKSLEAHSALGDFYRARRDAAQAEREYKAAAELAPDFLPAWRRLAEIALFEGRYDDSTKALDAVFKRNPADLEGHFLRGRVHIARGETTAAIEEFQNVLKLEPRSAPAHYQLALAYFRTSNLRQTKAELKAATTIAPNFTDAILLAADLDIQTGAPDLAIEGLEKLVANQPNEIRAYMLLGSAYLAKREPAKATETYRTMAAKWPRDPRGPYFVGLGLRAQGNQAEATREFGTALVLAPGYVDPLAQLVSMAFAESQPDAALRRVKKQIALAPRVAGLHYLLGTVYQARGEAEPAEAAYLKALALEPRFGAAYLQLGALYGATGRYEKALAELNKRLKASPKDVSALMLAGIIYERKGDVDKAEEAYQKVLADEPRFAPAANNLAWLYSEHGGDQGRALQLAQTAKEAAPDDPHISDTLGWILYKRGVYDQALALLQQSAAKLPESAEVQYHLGMAAYRLGDKSLARRALGSSVDSIATFPGKEEARKLLGKLK